MSRFLFAVTSLGIIQLVMLHGAWGDDADESWFSQTVDSFTDEKDGWLDVSSFLARGGFLAMPIIITEPAVDGGLGMVAYFVDTPPAGSDLPPTRTIFGGVVTGNGSEGFGLTRSGSFGKGRFLYNASLAQGVPLLDFHPGNRDAAVGYTNDIEYAAFRVRYRFEDTGFSLGPSLRWRRDDVKLDTHGDFPRVEDFAGRETQLNSVGLEAHFDDRNNPLTPTSGLNAIADWQNYNQAVGSDVDFNSLSLFTAWFATHDAWTLGLMGSATMVSSGVPFYMLPDINIRGLERNRYTSDKVLSSEVELRRQLNTRWSVLAFTGYGKAFGDEEEHASTWGAGVRYRIARQLGLDVGLDYAFGPEQDVFYIQFGHAWGSLMD